MPLRWVWVACCCLAHAPRAFTPSAPATASSLLWWLLSQPQGCRQGSRSPALLPPPSPVAQTGLEGRGRGGAARRRGEAVAAATRGSGGRCAVAVTHGSARALETRERASVLRPAPSSSSSSSSSSSQMRTQSKAAPFGTGRSAANSTTLAPVRRLACRRSPTDGSLGGTPPVRTRAVATGFLSATPLSTPASSRRVLAYRWRPLPAAPPALATRCPMPE